MISINPKNFLLTTLNTVSERNKSRGFKFDLHIAKRVQVESPRRVSKLNKLEIPKLATTFNSGMSSTLMSQRTVNNTLIPSSQRSLINLFEEFSASTQLTMDQNKIIRSKLEQYDKYQRLK